MGLLPNRKACDYEDKNRWVRGIADMIIVDGDTAHIVDYKTGKANYPDPMQLKLMGLMVFAHFPHIRKVNGALLFVVKNDMKKSSYLVEDSEAHWWDYRERVARIEQAWALGSTHPLHVPVQCALS